MTALRIILIGIYVTLEADYLVLGNLHAAHLKTHQPFVQKLQKINARNHSSNKDSLFTQAANKITKQNVVQKMKKGPSKFPLEKQSFPIILSGDMKVKVARKISLTLAPILSK